MNATNDPAVEAQRKRRIRRNSILLMLLAASFYVAFIVMNLSQN